mmetsp:Transcript_6780/g.14470  ORF Transcript_6780/g.14470 Transcript_6780/m.14470 type:complete len:237 (-) Transcript_6780:34-744(-)
MAFASVTSVAVARGGVRHCVPRAINAVCSSTFGGRSAVGSKNSNVLLPVIQAREWRRSLVSRALPMMAAGGVWASTDHTMNIVEAVMKANEAEGFTKLADADVSVIQGIGANADAALRSVGVSSVRKLAEWKYGKWAQAIVTLAELEKEGERPDGCALNMNKAIDKEYETKSLKEILDLPPSALQGLTPKSDEEFKKIKITTIEKLGNWKFLKIAQAIVEMAAVEETSATTPRKSK